jgi:integrase/recombinase XerD
MTTRASAATCPTCLASQNRYSPARPGTFQDPLQISRATEMWDAGMREMTLQKRLGHRSPDSTRIYTRVTDEQVVKDYQAALHAQPEPDPRWAQ